MNSLFQAIGQFTRGFLRDDDGAQVIEYALIIAVVSITLVVALKALTANGGSFSLFIASVGRCLTGGACP
ncbi:pilus assembly protein Flp/PilA [Variovorax paradoxus]|uniref:Flp family type IVb pilin n=1 Tax=Variovorax paradoxus TaxID=34073 RepID=UPI0027811BC9|nr:Flp family type IVb pilin [Variovorax paradoxus]MDP9962498.1 pilus assembly protein Flp/PilA [Variovorax paradoxus]